MTVANKIPTMDDSALATLHGNAERLLASGTSAQKTAAAALIPSIKAELDARNAAQLSKKVEALAARRGTAKGKSRAAATG